MRSLTLVRDKPTIRGSKQRQLPGQTLPIKNLKPAKQVFYEIRNYLAGQFVGATRDEALLDEVLKCLFCKLYLETAKTAVPEPDGNDTFETAQFHRAIFANVREDFPDIYKENDEILLDPRSLQWVMQSLNFSLLDADSDAIGDAYEVFAGSESRARAGQFFTPRNAADFLVKAVAPKPGEKIIDPACGAGGFLAAVARHFRRQGLSVLQAAKAASNFYGIEKDRYLTNLARLHVSLLTGGHPHVWCGDSLSLRAEQDELLKARIPVSGYDVLLTNPPFGINIVAASPEVLRTFELARRWTFDESKQQWLPRAEVRSQVPPQVLFVERCLSLLRDGGRLGMVLPESVLSNKSYRHVVEYIRDRCRVEAVVGMPESLFKTSGKGGTHTKTCLLVLTKVPRTNGRKRVNVFMAEARWCGHDSRARAIPYDDMPKIGENFETFMRERPFPASALGFVIRNEHIAENVLCPRYYDPELDAELKQLAKTHRLLRFGELVERGWIALSTGNEVGKLAYGSGEIPFVRTSDLSNWEIKVDTKHCVDRELYLTLKDKQDVQPGDILMVRDGTYLIGTCAIVTERDREIVFQSHIYKIRVLKNPHRLNPFLLLAVLSSPVVQRQIRAKQFTQDIIDSLGERVGELLLPIPESKRHCAAITDITKRVIEHRVHARDLARRARIEVLQPAGKHQS